MSKEIVNNTKKSDLMVVKIISGLVATRETIASF